MIKRQLVIFLLVGAFTVLLDYLTYRSLIELEVMGVGMAKAIGFFVGTVFAYFANRFFTFGYKSYVPGSALRFATLYVTTLTLNVLVNDIVLELLGDTVFSAPVAFMFATCVSATLNFFGLKLFVFKINLNSYSR
jgi:putative flippase GtrA